MERLISRNRLIVSCTTTPRRIHFLRPTLDSILQQTRIPELVYVNVPYRLERTGESYEVPAWLKSMQRPVWLNRTQDWGPSTKLLGVLHIERDSDTIIVTIDDDILYPPKMIEEFDHFCNSYPEEALGSCGFIWKQEVDKHKNVFEHLAEVEVLQGFAGIAYRRGFFRDDLSAYISQLPDFCRFADDILLANYLARTGIKRRVLMTEGLSGSQIIQEGKCDHGLEEDALHLGAVEGLTHVERYRMVIDHLRHTGDYAIASLAKKKGVLHRTIRRIRRRG